MSRQFTPVLRPLLFGELRDAALRDGLQQREQLPMADDGFEPVRSGHGQLIEDYEQGGPSGRPLGLRRGDSGGAYDCSSDARVPNIRYLPKRSDARCFECGRGGGRKNRVVLNVGGQQFETSIETLRTGDPSMLAAMVKRHLRDEDEAMFIDRDPVRFRHVLNYLRCGTVCLDDVNELAGLQEEADFFGLSDLFALCDEKIQEMERIKEEREEAEYAKEMREELRAKYTLRAMIIGHKNKSNQSQARRDVVVGIRKRGVESRLDFEMPKLPSPVFSMDEEF